MNEKTSFPLSMRYGNEKKSSIIKNLFEIPLGKEFLDYRFQFISNNKVQK